MIKAIALPRIATVVQFFLVCLSLLEVNSYMSDSLGEEESLPMKDQSEIIKIDQWGKWIKPT